MIINNKITILFQKYYPDFQNIRVYDTFEVTWKTKSRAKFHQSDNEGFFVGYSLSQSAYPPKLKQLSNSRYLQLRISELVADNQWRNYQTDGVRSPFSFFSCEISSLPGHMTGSPMASRYGKRQVIIIFE